MRSQHRTARPVVLAALVLAAVVLAACGDAPDPTVLAVPEARPSLDIAPPGGTGPIPPALPVAVTLHVGGQGLFGDAGVPGTAVWFVTDDGFIKPVYDNSTGDADPRVGYYRVTMPKVISYTAYVRVMPEEYTGAGAYKTVSAFVTPTLVSMGSIVLKRKPGIYVQLVKQGVLAPGQTITVSQVGGAWSRTIADGSADDLSAVGGRIHLRVPVTGTYTVCALTSPSPLWEADCEQVFALQYWVAYPVTLTYHVKPWSPPL